MESISVVEAKRQFHNLLRRVSDGEQFVITSHGRPVAKLSAPDTTSREQRRAAIARILELRKGTTLGVDWKELVNEGRP